jgi:hypothetical protein
MPTSVRALMTAKGLRCAIESGEPIHRGFAALLTWLFLTARARFCYDTGMKTLRFLMLVVLAALPVGARSGAAAVQIPVRAPNVSANSARPVLPFIEDDYPRALTEARAKKIPIFIEAWAPW